MTSPVKEGEILAGKYRVERTLGVGGMGVVVAARHIQLDDQVALKFLLPQALEDAELVARFQREARAAVKIKGEHVAKVIDVGTLDTGAPFMVMEYLQGGDLEQLVERRGALPVDEAVDYLMQACEAMAEAHALGIVHRDLKPANLFLSQRPDTTPIVKVLDFGISKALKAGEDASVTRTTAVMGSPLYMSPEQLRASRNVDARTDLWSLGVILYELVMGSTPFLAPTMPQLCAVILAEEPIPLDPDLPEPLQRAIMKCLAKDPNDRYTNIAKFTADIYRLGRPHNIANYERIKRISEAAGLSVSMPNDTLLADAAAINAMTSPARTTGRNTSTAWAEGKSGAHSIPQPEAGSGSKRLVIGAAVGLAALAGVAFVGLNLRDRATPPVENVVATQPPAPPPAEKKVHLKVAAAQPGAKIFIDNGEVSNPFVAQKTPSDAFTQIRVEAPGFKPKTMTVQLLKDTEIDLDLDPEPVPEPVVAEKNGGHKSSSKHGGKAEKGGKTEAKPAETKPTGLQPEQSLN